MHQVLNRRVEFDNIIITLHTIFGSSTITIMVTSNYDSAIYSSVMKSEREWSKMYKFAKDLNYTIKQLQREKTYNIIETIYKSM